MKLLMQELWDPELDWDAPLPEPLRLRHKVWREELTQLSDFELSRCYYDSEPAEEIELHGFSDASERAFGAVVYVRATYKSQPPTVKLVVAKNRVVPLKEKKDNSRDRIMRRSVVSRFASNSTKDIRPGY